MSHLKLKVSWWLLSWILKDKDDFPNSAGDWLYVTESTWIHPDLPSATFLFHLGSCHQGFTWCHTRVDISCVSITQPLICSAFCCCCSVAKLCPTLWYPVDCSMPGFCNNAHFSVRDKPHFPSSCSNLCALGEADSSLDSRHACDSGLTSQSLKFWGVGSGIVQWSHLSQWHVRKNGATSRHYGLRKETTTLTQRKTDLRG